jgi:hypothetical protein
MKIRISWVMAACICVCLMVLVTAAVVPALADNNTAYGTNAGQDDGGSGFDTSFGYYTASNNCFGSYNTATGAQAGQYQQGSNNTATGVNALRGPFCDCQNSKVGCPLMEGSDNTATGVSALEADADGSANTATGKDALQYNTTGDDNTATGWSALQSNTTGINNTATGWQALLSNTMGYNNTATGWGALELNASGFENTATGQFALHANTTGNQNTADGKAALFGSTGSFNTGTGYKTLFSNTGSYNTAAGWQALFSNTSGIFNTASGVSALSSNMTGSDNTAIGGQALEHTTTGANNTAVGVNALFSNTTGSRNIGIGRGAGVDVITGSNNIDIANAGAPESDTIRIGTSGFQTRAFIAGISGVTLSGADVVVSSAGQLGIVMSSARFKRDIRDMGAASEGLMKLRPVSFRYKNDLQGIKQYGLVAEEVAQLYPELVTHGADGKVETVRYSVLTSMLLNELQKQGRKSDRQADEIQRLSAQVAELKASQQRQRAAFEDRLATVERALAAQTTSGKLASAR